MNYYNNNDTFGSDIPEKTTRKGCGCFILLVILLLFNILPVCMIGVSSFFLAQENKTADECTYSVEAEIIENKVVKRTTRSGTHRSSRRTTTSYAPVYSFTYMDKEYNVKSNNSSNPAKYKVGDMAEILINPDDPNTIYDPNYELGSEICLMFICIGSGLILLEIIAFIFIRKKAKAMNENYYSGIN
ncbi:MAG: DUF3592 domain-containing protein [Ruminococcus sp.]|nr:DUF3592 domain-containing protein [Ruminococcus sp.]